MDTLIDSLSLRVMPFEPAAACRISDACARWKRGFNATLNFGDCFADRSR